MTASTRHTRHMRRRRPLLVACSLAAAMVAACAPATSTPGTATPATSPPTTTAATDPTDPTGAGGTSPSDPAVTVPPLGTPTPTTASPTTSTPTTPPTSPSTPAPPTTSSSTSPAPTRAEQILAEMTLEEQVGQLIMAGSPAKGPADAALVDRLHLGSVILTGRSHGSVADTAAISARLQAAATADGGPGLIVAADQEGGAVQVFQGSGFDRMPDALAQASANTPAELTALAKQWGAELAAAGINLNLAPVLDTVDPAFAPRNAPIGYWDRQYGATAAEVSRYGRAFAAGMRSAGVAASIKHFPGLGRVTDNTDLAAHVIDDTIDADSDDLIPFADAIADGAETVMISSAVYARIDDGVPGVFSSVIINGLLREKLGFTGVVITDDIGAAKQVSSLPVGQRAIRFVEAGGDIALSVDAGAARTMYDALVAAARSDETLRARIAESALRVLELKDRLGVLG